MPQHTFGSDNHAGAHPEVIAAIAEANAGHAIPYGDDPWTARAQSLFEKHFGPAVRAFPLLTGTAANVLAIAATCKPWEAVLCTDVAHLLVDECGAPQQFAGVHLQALPKPDGKLTPADLRDFLSDRGDVHRVQPRLVTITNSTEWGTVYTPDEIRALADACHVHGLLLHLDGARLANAAAALGVPLRALTTDAGVDLVSFGGTKNGALMAEALLVLKDGLEHDVPFLRKRAMQLVSKGRFVSAQLVALLDGDLWLRSARHANAMTRRLADGLSKMKGISLRSEPTANAIFATVPPRFVERLSQKHGFGWWDKDAGLVRLMCAFDTTTDGVDGFLADASEVLVG